MDVFNKQRKLHSHFKVVHFYHVKKLNEKKDSETTQRLIIKIIFNVP